MASLEASLKLNDQFTNVLNKINSGLQKASGNMQEFKDKISGPAKALQSLGNSAADGISKLNSSIKSKMESASNVVKSSTEKILSIFGNFGNRISSKLGLSGVTQKFSSTFSSIKVSVSDAMGAVTSKVSSAVSRMKAIILGSGPAFKQFGSEIKASFDKINTSITTVGDKLMNVAKVAAVAGTAALVGLGKKVYDIAGGFESQMSRVQAISGATGDAFTQLRDQAIDLGAKTAFSATESATGMENLASAGFNAQEIFAAMPGLLDLAAVSGGDVALASENTATALRGFGLDASQAGHVANVFARAAADTNAEVADMGEAMKYVAPVANSMGLSLEEVAASVGIMSDAGVKGSQAGTTLRGALSRLARPTDAMVGVMDSLGVSFYDSNGNMKSLTDQVGMLQNAFKDLTPEQQQNALVTLYGQESLSGMMALIAKGPDALNKLTTSLKNSNGAAAEMAATMQNNLKSKVEQLGGALESTAIRIGDKLFPLISPQIEKLTEWIDKTFSKVNVDSFFDKLSKYGKVIKSAFDDVKGPISDAFGAIGDSLDKINGKFGSAKNVDKFKSALASVTDVIKGLANFVEKHSDGIATLISNLPKLMAAFVGFKIGSGVLGTLTTFGSGLLGAAKASGTLVTNLAKLGNKKQKTPAIPTPSIPSVNANSGTATNPFAPLLDTFNGFAKSAGKLAIIFGVIKLIEEAAQALQDINNKVPKDLSDLAPKMLNMAIALTAMGAFVKVANNVIGNDIKGAATGLAVVAGISANLIIASIALQQVNDRVSDDVSSIAQKIANIAIGIGAMGLLVGIAGALANANPAAAIAGLLVVAALSIELMVVAEALKQVQDKVSDNIGSVAKKIGGIGIAILAMAGFATVIGAFMATGIGTIIVGAGLTAILGAAYALSKISKAIGQVEKQVPDKIGNVKKKIKSLVEVVETISDSGLGSAVGALKSLFGANQADNAFNAIQSLIKIADQIQLLATMGNIPDMSAQLIALDRNVAQIQNASTTFGQVDPVNAANAIQAIDSLNQLVPQLITLGSQTIPEGIESKLVQLDSIMEKIQNTTTNFGKLYTGTVSNAVVVVADLTSLVTNLGKLDGETIPSSISDKLTQLDSIMEKIQNTTTNFGKLYTGTVSNAIGVVDNLVSLVENLGKLESPTIPEGIESKLVQLDSIMEKIQNTTTNFGKLYTGTVSNATNVVDNLVILIDTLKNLNKKTIPEGIESKLVQLDTIMEKIQNTTTNLGKIYTGTVSDAVGVVDDLISLIQRLNMMSTHVIPDGLMTQLGTLDTIMAKIQATSDVAGKIQTSTATSATAVVDGLISLIQRLNTMITHVVPDGIMTQLSTLDIVIEKIQNTTTKASGLVPDNIANANLSIDSLMVLIDKSNELSTKLASFVAPDLSALQSMLNSLAGLNGGGVSIAATSIQALSTSLTTASASTNTLTTALGQVKTSVDTLVTGMQTAGSQIITVMTQSMTQARAAVSSGTTAMASAFSSGMSLSVSVVIAGNARIVGAFSGLRGQLQSAGYYAMSGLAAGIAAGSGSAIAQAKSVADQVSSTIRSALKIHSPSRVMIAVGQFVGQGLANGIAATKSIVSKASNMLAMASVPSPIADLSSSGTVTSNVQLDDSEISRLKTSASQQVVVNHKQVVPQVTINVENNNGEPIDTEALLQEFEDRIEEMIDSDLS